MPPVMSATSWDTLLHIVMQGGVIQTSKRCKQWRDCLKQTNGKDNLTSGMQIISMVTIFIVRNLAIKLLNVESMDKDWCSTPQGGLWIKEIFFTLTILQKLWSNDVYAIKLDICLPNVLWKDVIHHLAKDTKQKDASNG